MANVQITLFQKLVLRTETGTLIDLGSYTVKSLFAYLILHHTHNLDQQRVAYSLWPRRRDNLARRNLRHSLQLLRKGLASLDPDGTLIFAEGNTLRFSLPADWQVDVIDFETAAAASDLSRAIDLYGGELLPDILEDWIRPERERLLDLYLECLKKMAGQHEAAGEYLKAIPYAERYLEAEPLLEMAHLYLMTLHYAAGNLTGVKQQYEKMAAMLKTELGAAPPLEVVAAYEAMMAGEYGGPGGSIHQTFLAEPETSTTAPPSRLAGETAVTPFVDREAELSCLNDGLAQAIAGEGKIYLISGGAGTGKTRLVTEWLAHAQTAALVLSGQGYEFEAMLPYAPLARALRRAETSIPWSQFAPPPSWLVGLQSLLPNLPEKISNLDFATNGRIPNVTVSEALENFILALTKENPVVLYLDNMQWADKSTWKILNRLALLAPTAPLMIVLVADSEALPAAAKEIFHAWREKDLLQEIAITSLSEAATEELARLLMPDDQLDPLFLRRLYEEAGGHPFLVVDTIRAVRSAGGEWGRTVPTRPAGQPPTQKMQAVIETRLEKLSADSRTWLVLAAAIQGEFTYELLQQVSGATAETLQAALGEWLVYDLVHESHHGYEFAFDKVSHIAYAQLNRAERKWVHRRLADYWSDPELNAVKPGPAQIAHHYYLSDQPEKALPYLAQAGEQALNVHAYEDAREFGLRAIGLLGRMTGPTGEKQAERIDLNLQLAQAYAYTGALPKALQILQETERFGQVSGDSLRLAHIYRRSAQMFWLLGQPDIAIDYAQRTLRRAEELDNDELRFASLRMLGRASVIVSHYDDAIAYLLRYIAQVKKGAALSYLPIVYGHLGVAYARVGAWARAIKAAQSGLDLVQRDGLDASYAVALTQFAFIYTELREWEKALEVVAPIHNLWQDTGMSPYAFTLRTVIGRSLVHMDNVETGLAEIKAALQWAEKTDYQVIRYVPELAFAECLCLAGLYPAARAAAVTAGEMAATASDQWASAVALRIQAEVDMEEGQPTLRETEDMLVRAVNVLRQIRARPDLARAYLVLRRLYDRAGQIAWAVDCHFRATTIFDELGMIKELQGALGQAAIDRERTGAVVRPDQELRGPLGNASRTEIRPMR